MKQITISLDDFIVSLLGSEKKGARDLPSYESAVILHALIKDGLLYKVQFEWWDGTLLEVPKLWSYDEWSQSNNNWKSQKKRQKDENIRDWIFKANVKIISSRLQKEFLSPEDKANATAFSWLKGKKYGKIRGIGISKLITREEELI